MPFNWIEDSTSRSATIYRLGRRDPSTRQRVWNIIGSADEDAVHAEINAKISSQYAYWNYPGQPLVRLRAESYSVEYMGDTAWRVTVSYEKLGADDPAQTAPKQRSRGFDTSGGTMHITQAIERVTVNGTTTTREAGEKVYGPSGLGSGPSMKGTVNVDDQGVNGVDIVVPDFKWTETYDVPAKFLTVEYAKRIAWLTGTTNDAPFRGFKKGEVLFAGATGSHEKDQERGDGPGSVSFTFHAKPNAGPNGTIPATTIGDISGIEAEGWEYVWIKFATKDDATHNTITRVPLFVYVNKVYRDGDFSQLGIGTD